MKLDENDKETKLLRSLLLKQEIPMKSAIALLFVSLASYLTCQSCLANGIYGEWILDVNAMAQQLEHRGIPKATIEDFKNKNGNGLTKTTISKDTMAVTLMGKRADLNYKAEAKHEDCTTITLIESARSLEYCVHGDVLEVRNESNAFVEVFNRSRH